MGIHYDPPMLATAQFLAIYVDRLQTVTQNGNTVSLDGKTISLDDNTVFRDSNASKNGQYCSDLINRDSGKNDTIGKFSENMEGLKKLS